MIAVSLACVVVPLDLSRELLEIKIVKLRKLSIK